MEAAQPFNPFPGLRTFEANENHLFFGRDGQTDEILSRLGRNRLLAVVGSSGSGKSSLIRAGLLPLLHGGFMSKASSDWRVAIMRPGDNPIENLALALNSSGIFDVPAGDADTQALIIEATLRRSALGLLEAVKQARISSREQLLIVVDQFEELFRFEQSRTGLSEDDAAAFVKLLLEAARQDETPIYVVLTMRSDFIGDCARFRDLPETINQGLYLIPRMTRDQRREAITGPVAVAGATISARLVNRLLNDVGDNPDQLPILQHALMRTWDLWSRTNNTAAIDLIHYEAIGGMEEALSRHADEAYHELSDRGREVAERLFKALTEKGPDNREVRRPTSVGEICALSEARERDVVAVIDAFRQAGRSFLTPAEGPLGSDTIVDISHESLIRGWQRLRDWVEREALSAAIYRRVAETAVLHQENKAGLWRDPDLQVGLAWREKAQPNQAWATRYHPEFSTAMAFLDQSRQARDAELVERENQRKRELRRTRAFAFALGVAFLLSSALGFWALAQTRKARQAEERANQQARVADEQREEANKQKDNTKRALDDVREKTIALEGSRNKLEAALEQATEAERKANESARQAQAALKAEREQKQLTLEMEQVARTRQQQAERLSENVLLGRTLMLSSNQQIDELTDQLIEIAHPAQRVALYRVKQLALTGIGDHEAALNANTEALKIEPRNVRALAGRAAEYIQVGKADKAIQDLQLYLQLIQEMRLSQTDEAKETTAYLNLAISLGMLGKYDQALQDLDLGIRRFVHNGDHFDTEVSPDIKRVTGQPVIYTDSEAFRIALHYYRAHLQAAAGGNEGAFVDALKAADSESRKYPRPMDAYLSALNWNWLHIRTRPDDYGALVAQGALWERAAFIQDNLKELARFSYAKFLQEHEARRVARYDNLASWVRRQLVELDKPHEAPFQIANARELITEADEQRALGHNLEAEGLLNKAVQIEPTNVDLLLKRVRLHYQRRDYNKVREGSEKVLELEAQNPLAYIYLAYSYDNQLVSVPEKAEANYRKALQYDPANQNSLSAFSRLLSQQGRKEEALLHLNRAISLNGDDSGLLYRKAQLLRAERSPEDLNEALKSISLAIAIKGDDLKLYDEREEIEKALGKNKIETLRRRADGYMEAGNIRRRLGRTGEALNAYFNGLETLAKAFDQTSNSGATDQEKSLLRPTIVSLVYKISDLIEAEGSRKAALDFWKNLAASKQWPSASQILNDEMSRLASGS